MFIYASVFSQYLYFICLSQVVLCVLQRRSCQNIGGKQLWACPGSLYGFSLSDACRLFFYLIIFNKKIKSISVFFILSVCIAYCIFYLCYLYFWYLLTIFRIVFRVLVALNGKPIIYIIQRALCGLFELWALLFMTFILSCVYITQTTR